MSTTTPANMSPMGGGMFEHFREAKNRKLPPWAYPLFMGCAAFAAALLFVMWVKTIWALDRLPSPKSGIDLAVAPPPPPPPPPPPGGAKPHEQVITPRKIKVKDIVQPVKIEKQEEKPVDNQPDGEEGGEEGGQVGGTVGGDINGSIGAPPPPPPPPPPPMPPQVVPPAALEASRISGEKMIEPDDVTKTEIQRSGKDRIVGTYKLCLTVDGAINTVNMLKSTGFSAYDNKILSTIRSSWRYRPFMVNGRAAPVCTAVTFIYSQH